MADQNKINVQTGNLDKVRSDTDLNKLYLRLDTDNDPLTGALTITPTGGTTALTANLNIVLKAGQKLVFDG